MPLVLQIIRGDEPLVLQWDYFHLSCFYTACLSEATPEVRVNSDEPATYGDLGEGDWIDFSQAPIYYMTGAPIFDQGSQTLERDHVFRTKRRKNDEEASDWEDYSFELKAGDVLKAHRERSSYVEDEGVDVPD